MAIIYCPQCDSEIPDNETICPSCGFNLDDYDESETDKEFNALLNAANKKLSEENEEEEEEEEETGEPAASGGAISQSQIDALLDGNVVDLGGGEKKKKPKKKKVKKAAPVQEKRSEPVSEQVPVAVVEKTAEADAAEKAEPSESAEKAAETEKSEVREIPAVNGKAPVRNAAVKKERKGGVSPILTIITAVVAAALGFCVSLLLFGNLFRTPEETFAIRAANAINSKLTVNEQLCVYKAYVKLGTAADECIIYAITDYKDIVSAAKYRVVVNKDNGNVVNVYYTIDENSEEYLAMKNSDDPEVRVQASVLKNYSDSIENAHREISIGTPSWVSVDISEINSNITSVQIKETKE